MRRDRLFRPLDLRAAAGRRHLHQDERLLRGVGRTQGDVARSAEPHFSQRQYRAFEPQRIVCFDVGALQVYGLFQRREVFVRRAGGGFRRPAAGDQEDCGEAGRGNPVYHGESVRDRLFGDIEPVVGEHIVERLSEQ